MSDEFDRLMDIHTGYWFLFIAASRWLGVLIDLIMASFQVRCDLDVKEILPTFFCCFVWFECRQFVSGHRTIRKPRNFLAYNNLIWRIKLLSLPKISLAWVFEHFDTYW